LRFRTIRMEASTYLTSCREKKLPSKVLITSLIHLWFTTPRLSSSRPPLGNIRFARPVRRWAQNAQPLRHSFGPTHNHSTGGIIPAANVDTSLCYILGSGIVTTTG